VQQQIGKLRALLHKIQPSHACGFALEFGCRNPDHLGKDVAGVMKVSIWSKSLAKMYSLRELSVMS